VARFRAFNSGPFLIPGGLYISGGVKGLFKNNFLFGAFKRYPDNNLDDDDLDRRGSGFSKRLLLRRLLIVSFTLYFIKAVFFI